MIHIFEYMGNTRIFTAAAILLLAIWAGYNLYMTYTSPSYCPMGNHGIYSYSNLLPLLLIVILALSLLQSKQPPSRSARTSGLKKKGSGENPKSIQKVRVEKKIPELLSIIKERPGITQEELRELTGYSASKVSIELKELEEKGLIRREKHGRTYRIYPE